MNEARSVTPAPQEGPTLAESAALGLPVTLTSAQQALVLRNVGLVRMVAARYAHIPREDFVELQGQLYLRLCLTVQKWDPLRGFKISSYVVKSLECEAKNFFRDHIWLVRPPRSLRERSMSEVLDSVGDSTGIAALTGEDPDVVRSCAIPHSLDLLMQNQDEDEELFLMADIDVEGEVVDRIGGHQLVREIYQALAPEERLILALQGADARTSRPGTVRRLKSPTVEIQRRFLVGRTTSEAAQAELQQKLQRYHGMVNEGEPLPLSLGNRTLHRALLPRFRPPDVGFAARRGCPQELVLTIDQD